MDEFNPNNRPAAFITPPDKTFWEKYKAKVLAAAAVFFAAVIAIFNEAIGEFIGNATTPPQAEISAPVEDAPPVDPVVVVEPAEPVVTPEPEAVPASE